MVRRTRTSCVEFLRIGRGRGWKWRLGLDVVGPEMCASLASVWGVEMGVELRYFATSSRVAASAVGSMVVYLDSEDDDEEELTSSEVSTESEPDCESEVRDGAASQPALVDSGT